MCFLDFRRHRPSMDCLATRRSSLRPTVKSDPSDVNSTIRLIILAVLWFVLGMTIGYHTSPRFIHPFLSPRASVDSDANH